MKIDKPKRLAQIDNFVAEYGRGDIKLTDAQKKARMEKYIADDIQSNKILGIGKNPEIGVQLIPKMLTKKIDENHEGIIDKLPVDVLTNIEQYPHDTHCIDESHKIIHMEVHDDGSMDVMHLIIDGNEKDPRHRLMSSVSVLSDEASMKMEYALYKQGKLKQVSDRTLILHKESGHFDALFDDPNIDTDPDKKGQM